MEDHENDLPMMANVSEILVYHFILDLKCELDKQQLCGSITLYTKPRNDDQKTLDSAEINKETKSLSGNANNITDSYFRTKDDVCDVIDDPNRGSGSLSKGENQYDTTSKGSTYQDHQYSSNINVHKSVNNTSDSIGNLMNSYKSNNDTVTKGDNPSEAITNTPSSVITSNIHTNNPSYEAGLMRNDINSFPEGNISNNSGKSQDDQLSNNGIQSSTNSPCKGDNNVGDDFCMILDANDIDILSVEELVCTHVTSGSWNELNQAKERKKEDLFSDGSKCFKTEQCWSSLQYFVSINCIKIWKQGVKHVNKFPGIIKINYKTLVKGQSLKWTLDQDGRRCVYTHGHWINNRSLFPSQDHPAAMATWEATVLVSEDVSVIMSGDDIPEIKHEINGYKSYLFKTSMAMPSSTLSLAVGYWTKYTIIDRNNLAQSEADTHDNGNGIQCSLYSPDVLFEKTKSELDLYVPVCIKTAIDLLGQYPFKKLDIIVVPSSFDSLGMASPGVLYLSQSLIQGDYSMLIRLSHEVSHTWFGIVIGPEDWTEEWLTEGFCTYTEDIIHAEVMKRLDIIKESDIDDIRDIRDYLKYRNLVSELQNTKVDLQTLRPNKDTGSNCEGYIKNGMNSDKRFIQVHYLKGYFLLRYLEQKVGQAKFLQFIRQYVQQFYGQLVSSEDVIKCLFKVCPELRSMGLEERVIYDDWLDYPGLPHVLTDYKLKAGNVLAECVINQEQVLATVKTKCLHKLWHLYYRIQKIQRIKDIICHKRQRKKRKYDFISIFVKMCVEQLMLFLELLLDEEHLPLQLLCNLRDYYKPHTINAEVQHRWCELIIKHKCKIHYDDVKSFLINHQAMGVYLFGEMVISRDKKQKQLAEECFNEIKDEMEPDPYKTVHMMLYGY